MIIVSACLIGIACRYDGMSKADEKVIQYIQDKQWIPVCPEQMGGLPTPRERAEIVGNRVLSLSGKDVTEAFEKGAKEILKLTKMACVTEAVLKAMSPSCGCGMVYDGTFSGILRPGSGKTAQILMENGIRVISEEML
ncbi:DUF523 domain-containing protein [Desulfonema magnum]|uniref:DUF523 n=1 Tax=Desulfonema magnum TaxID=45655 RepID=A0A975BJ17_9BACT|nr:DUF523 domain-containing protein [Desulfonema magnum]QTA86614.1 DUF523 [Desulfonema magnum]